MFHVKRPGPLAHLEQDLAALETAGLRRVPGPPRPAAALSFCSNDYLGLAAEPPPPAASGAGASRLIAGDREEHRRAERQFASWLDCEDALLFTSGYAANVGVLTALARRSDLLVSDVLNHASIIDGARLSRATVEVVPHLDTASVARALERPRSGRAWVVVESYYSMDADTPDLPALRRICDRHGAALVVDEAHALGVLGPGGRGRCAEAGIRPDVLVGTLGKAFGAQGAFVAGSRLLRDWLWNSARTFVFSTGLAPSSAAAACRAQQHVARHPEIAERVVRLAARFRAGLTSRGVAGRWEGTGPALIGEGHILPLILGSPDRALTVAGVLRAQGVEAHAIRPPTVPDGSARVRFTVTARHQEDDIDRAVEAVVGALAHGGP